MLAEDRAVEHTGHILYVDFMQSFDTVSSVQCEQRGRIQA